MTKRKAIREIKEIMNGTSGMTNIKIWKNGRSWETETSLNKFDDYEENSENGIIQFQHCCNEITLRQVEDLLNEETAQKLN